MRITAGKFKSRHLNTPKGLITRPTSGKLRQAVFNMLQQHIEGASFLDVFAGSGAMGLEAISQGAEHAVFLEKSRNALECISKNIEILNVQDQARILKGDVMSSLKKLQKDDEQFDVIYIDPPYTSSKEEGLKGETMSVKVLTFIDHENLLKDNGILFIEESKEAMLEAIQFRNLALLKQRAFGRSHVFCYQRAEK